MNKSERTDFQTRVIYFGTPEFAAVPLAALLQDNRYQVGLVVTQPDRPAGRGSRLKASEVKQLALQYDLPILQPDRVKKNLSDFLKQCGEFGSFDIGVVCAFGQILPIEVLNFPTHGCVNIHASLLPRWRGAAPIQRAIMEGDHVTGVCLMQMEAGLDTGPVYSKKECPITESTTTGALHNQLAAMGAELIVSDLIKIVHEEIRSIAQDDSLANYARKIENHEAEIDWNRPAEQILRQIHGLSPFPGAFTMLDTKRLKIFSVSISSSKLAVSQIKIEDKALLIGTATQALRVLELQVEGKRKMSTTEFLTGFNYRPGLQVSSSKH